MVVSDTTIRVSNLTKRFGALTAVDQLSFEVRRGEIFGLVGPDGAGKTTTLRILAGVLQADGGSVSVAGCDVLRDPEKAKHDLSYMPQRFGLYEDLTVAENIRFYADLFGVTGAKREPQAARLLAAAGMAEFRRRLAGKLSGGMKQKLGLICALIHTPQVVLLDEPTTGVDPVSRRDFWKILYGLALEGVTILTSTAYLDEAERCHRVALLHQGKLLFCDTPASLKRRLGKDVIAVTSAEPRKVRDALSRAEGISTLVLTGDGVHAVVDDAVRRIPEFKSRLSAAQAPFDELSPILPSIEDLFVATVAQRGDASV
ncbi:MAG TPA: ABC transporter ATP-binding protein [Terriglobales bacterium]|nr:ABC transporter ATP-binding protein [Terriglobales bacterium]